MVDASVVVKWFIEEPFSSDAQRLRNDQAADLIRAHAPTLLPYEVLNAVRYSGLFAEEELRDVARAFDGFALSLHLLTGRLSQRAVGMALQTGLSLYDASYVALAQELGVPLYSADEEMLQAVGDVIKAVHVREYQTPSG